MIVFEVLSFKSQFVCNMTENDYLLSLGKLNDAAMQWPIELKKKISRHQFYLRVDQNCSP